MCAQPRPTPPPACTHAHRRRWASVASSIACPSAANRCLLLFLADQGDEATAAFPVSSPISPGGDGRWPPPHHTSPKPGCPAQLSNPCPPPNSRTPQSALHPQRQPLQLQPQGFLVAAASLPPTPEWPACPSGHCPAILMLPRLLCIPQRQQSPARGEGKVGCAADAGQPRGCGLNGSCCRSQSRPGSPKIMGQQPVWCG